jgi:hypothetical protein
MGRATAGAHGKQKPCQARPLLDPNPCLSSSRASSSRREHWRDTIIVWTRYESSLCWRAATLLAVVMRRSTADTPTRPSAVRSPRI